MMLIYLGLIAVFAGFAAIDIRRVIRTAEETGDPVPCIGITFDLCCEALQWPVWYPFNSSLPDNDPENLLALGFFVETFVLRSVSKSEKRERQSLYPHLQSLLYGCMDTRIKEVMEVEVPASERAAIKREVYVWHFVCMPGFELLKYPARSAQYDRNRRIRGAACRPRTRALQTADMKQPIRKGLLDCVDTFIDSAKMTRIEVVVKRPRIKRLRRSDDNYKWLEDEPYEEDNIPVNAPYVSLSDVTAFPGKKVEIEHRKVPGLVMNGAMLGHEYHACARAPAEYDIFLSIGAIFGVAYALSLGSGKGS